MVLSLIVMLETKSDASNKSVRWAVWTGKQKNGLNLASKRKFNLARVQLYAKKGGGTWPLTLAPSVLQKFGNEPTALLGRAKS